MSKKIVFIFLGIYSSDDMRAFVALDPKIKTSLILCYTKNVPVEIEYSELHYGESSSKLLQDISHILILLVVFAVQ